MPKRPRQAHVPQTKRRRARRTAAFEEEALYVAPPATSVAPGYTADVVARPGPTRPAVRAEAVPARGVPALPTYDRRYIAGELRRIAVLSGSLLASIIVLAIVLR